MNQFLDVCLCVGGCITGTNTYLQIIHHLQLSLTATHIAFRRWSHMSLRGFWQYFMQLRRYPELALHCTLLSVLHLVKYQHQVPQQVEIFSSSRSFFLSVSLLKTFFSSEHTSIPSVMYKTIADRQVILKISIHNNLCINANTLW